jgi:hypothetical protein
MTSVVRSIVPVPRLRAGSSSATCRASLLLSAAVALTLLCLVQGIGVRAAMGQGPIALPNTIATVAGGASGSGGTVTGGVLPVKGAACAAGSPYTATDAYGDGCPGLNTAFSSDFRGGLQVDGQGNVFIMDTTNSLLRRLDARSGLVTAVTGTSITGCTTSSDAYGDSCPLPQTKLSTARGVWVDPYGNALIAGYGMQTINIVCNAVSPLCPGTAGHKQVGSMYRIAGCVASATATGSTGSGITNGTSGDGYAASPYGNLAGDVSDWNPGGTANLGVTGYGSCTASATLGAVSSPRGVAADRYGNVYIAETGVSGAGYRYRVVVGPPTFTLPGGTVLTNPLASIIALDPAYSTLTAAEAYGKIYPVLGGFTAAATGVTPPTAINAACAGTAGGSTLDTAGDGCAFYESTSGTGQQGIGVDANGNVIFSDNSRSLVRVLFIEPTVATGAATSSSMARAIRAANASPALAVVQGYVYPIAGAVNSAASNTTVAATPTLGTTTTLSAGLTKVALDPAGNLYLSDFSNSSVLFFDITTGYIRRLFITGPVCAAKLDSAGDGCPVNASSFGSGASGMGIGLTPEGDLYLADNTNLLIRKVTASNLFPLAKGSTLTQSELIHSGAGATSVTATLLSPSVDISVGTVACAAANADRTLDCTVPVTFTPAEPGQRSNSLGVTSAGTNVSAILPVAGIASAAALVSDSASPTMTTLGSVTSATALAVDGQDNLFLADAGAGVFKQVSNTGATSTIGGPLPASTYQLAVDPQGDVYATSAGSASITRLTPEGSGAYTSSTFTFVPTQATAATPVSTPAVYGVAADHQGNLFVADRTNEAVYEIPATNLQAGNAGTSSLNPVLPLKTGLSQVGELALDGEGNLFIADPGAGSVYRLLAGSSATTVFAANVNPSHIAADAAGNLYIEDSTANTVSEYSTSGLGKVLVYAAASTPAGLAVQSSGAALVSFTGASAVTQVERDRATQSFGHSNGPASYLAGELTDAGNSPATGTAITAATGAKFIFDSAGPSTCGAIPSTANTLLAGASCSYTVYFNPATSGLPVSAAVTLLPSISAGSLILTGVEPSGNTFPTTTSVTGPATAVYSASGTEATYTVRVTAAGTMDVPTGIVTATSDCASGSGSYTLVGGTVNISVSGCIAAQHTLTVSYPNTGDAGTTNASFGNSTGSATTVFTQAPTSVTWSPSVTSVQYSAALGLDVLDATAASNGAAVPGTFIYSAANAAGAPVFVHSASYLPIGTYTLTGTFYPTDGTDFASSSETIPGFAVNKASTTAAVGATQALVAADGTGNFTSVQSAINSLPATGGSVYIKPGTYAGDVTVVQPGVSLRGLGGDPRAVVLTHSGGAFGGSGVYAYAGEFTSAQNNGAQLPAGSSLFSGDEGSATLVVAPGINTAVSASTLTPNGFYGENFTLQNTYDSDTTTTTTTYVSGGVCSANAGPVQTYNTLFNNSLLCASQALAIWNTADLSVFDNVYTSSLQDTIYAGSQGAGSNGYVPSRQYWFRGKVTGTVDYIFGDAAAVFDYSSIYTVPKGTSSGTETIEAQNKARQTGANGDYLSGYVMNSNVFTSSTTGMTGLEFGRPYGPYSTWLMLNSYVDQVAPAGYIEFSGDSNLPTSTYDEYNDLLYTDPASGAPDLNGVIYTGLGGNTGTGVTGMRETTSQSPGTPMSDNAVRTSMTQVQAQPYFPTNFLSTAVPGTLSSTARWIPTDALAAGVNGFVPAGGETTVVPGSSVTILMRPQTPGLGAVSNGLYTVPTGTYTLTDSFNGAASALASGTLDASGAAFYTSSTLAPGTHVLSWTYGGDSNFSGSTTAAAYNLVVSGYPTVTALSVDPATDAFGQSATATVQVSSATPGTLTGTVTLTIDSATSQTIALSGAMTSFPVGGLKPGSHILLATYNGALPYAASTSSQVTFVVSLGAPALTVNPTSVAYGNTNVALSASVAYLGVLPPSGAVTFTVNGSSAGVGPAICFGSASPLTCTAGFISSLAAGAYAVTATQAADANDAASTGQGILTVTLLTPAVLVSPVNVSYSTASVTLSVAIPYAGGAAPTGAVSLRVNGSAAGVGPVTCTGNTSPLTCTATYSLQGLAGGSYVIKASQAADANYAATSGTGTLTISAIAPAVSVSSITATFGVTSATLHASIAYMGAATPGGGLTFTVNGSAAGVGASTCSGISTPLTCTATYSVTGLAPGSYTVTATEAADMNYTAASDTGTLLLVAAADFTFGNSGAVYQTVVPGASVSYNFALAPVSTSYPGPVTFGVSGLPAGATYTLTPASVTANGGAQTVVLAIATVKPLSAKVLTRPTWRMDSGLAFGVLLLPLWLRRRLHWHSRRRLTRLLGCLAVLAALGTLFGCASGNGDLEQSPANYTVVVTATGGTVQHSASVTLNLQ